jgi:hypothetical protein
MGARPDSGPSTPSRSAIAHVLTHLQSLNDQAVRHHNPELFGSRRLHARRVSISGITGHALDVDFYRTRQPTTARLVMPGVTMMA